MNKKQIVIAASVAIIILAILFVSSSLGAKTTPDPASSSSQQVQDIPVASGITFAMDTIIEQKLYGENSQKAYDEIIKALRNIEDTISMHKNGTEIDKLNKSAGKEYVELTKVSADMLTRAKDFSNRAEGGFDLTIAPLALLWNITGDSPEVPTKEEIDNATSLINPNDVDIITENGTTKAMLKKEGMAVDLGGIAKGATCDIIREIAVSNGITSGFVSLGGNMMVIGAKPDGKHFVFGLRDPFGGDNDYFGTVEIPDKTMATTGGYERFFEEGGITYHHVLDPETGYPAETDLASVTVISKDGALADYLSTELFMIGVEGIKQLEKNQDFDMIAVDKDNTIYILGDIRHDFKPKSKDQSIVYLSE